MKIVFFCSSSFSIPSLRALLESTHKVLAVVTQPDKAKGRSLKISPPQVKVLAAANGISVYQPETVSSQEAVRYIRSLEPDLFVVVSFGQLLKKALLEVPRLYSINLHGSLLPKYRGAAPINWAVINGEVSSGAAIIRMNEKMDAGDIIASREVGIGKDDTALTMSEKIAEIGAMLLLESIDSIEKGTVKFERQDESKASYAPKLKKGDGLIEWNRDAGKIHNLVRGLIPWPGAYTHYNGKVLKVFRTEIARTPEGKAFKPGTIVDVISDKGIVASTAKGALLITHLQLEGKKILDGASFLRGHRIKAGDSLIQSG